MLDRIGAAHEDGVTHLMRSGSHHTAVKHTTRHVSLRDRAVGFLPWMMTLILSYLPVSLQGLFWGVGGLSGVYLLGKHPTVPVLSL